MRVVQIETRDRRDQRAPPMVKSQDGEKRIMDQRRPILGSRDGFGEVGVLFRPYLG
jgi:hypothetical protein